MREERGPARPGGKILHWTERYESAISRREFMHHVYVGMPFFSPSRADYPPSAYYFDLTFGHACSSHKSLVQRRSAEGG